MGFSLVRCSGEQKGSPGKLGNDCKPKMEGGLSLDHIVTKNVALMVK